jgi:hypothetical protein
MVSFRAGALNDRIRSGPLTAGGKTKRDLMRYYELLDEAMGEWWEAVSIEDESWDVIVAFINTRYWETIPMPKAFASQFDNFIRSPMAEPFGRIARSAAAAAIREADYLALTSIIDRAEVMGAASLKADATAGATSAAS